MGIGDVFRRNMLDQCLFYLIRCVVMFADKSKSVSNPIDMCIYCQCRFAKGHTLDDICRLTANTRQIKQGIHVCRYFPVMLFH